MPSAPTIEKATFRSGPFQAVFAQGVRVGDQLTLAGQVSMDESGDIVGAGDITAQFAQAYANVKAVLAEFGAEMGNIVDEAIYVTDFSEVMGNLDAIMAARGDAFGGTADVSQTMVEVQGLVFPELMVEIKCVARL